MDIYRLRRKGYDDAINLAKIQLSKLTPEEVENNTKAKWNGKSYDLPWFNTVIDIDESPIVERVLQYLYITRNGANILKNNLISFLQVPSGILKSSNFQNLCILPMLRAFANNFDRFSLACEKLGGIKKNLGHISYTLYPFPFIPLTYVMWQGDEEVADSGTILFDETIIDWFNAEEIETLTIICTQILIDTKEIDN